MSDDVAWPNSIVEVPKWEVWVAQKRPASWEQMMKMRDSLHRFEHALEQTYKTLKKMDMLDCDVDELT